MQGIGIIPQLHATELKLTSPPHQNAAEKSMGINLALIIKIYNLTATVLGAGIPYKSHNAHNCKGMPCYIMGIDYLYKDFIVMVWDNGQQFIT